MVNKHLLHTYYVHGTREIAFTAVGVGIMEGLKYAVPNLREITGCLLVFRLQTLLLSGALVKNKGDYDPSNQGQPKV